MNLDEEETINDNFLSKSNSIFKKNDILYTKPNYTINNNYTNSNVNNLVFDASRMYEFFSYKSKDEDDNQSQQYTNGTDYWEYCANLFMNKQSSINNFSEKEVNKNSLLNKKRNREKIFTIAKESKEEKNKPQKIIRGRKKTSINNNKIHNLLSEDNIVNKIKGHFFGFIRDIIEKKSQGRIKFKKLQYKYIANLKKNQNENLLKTKMKDILSKLPISKKYKKYNEYENKVIINKIYEEKKEKSVIKILNLTFNQLFILFRRNLKKPDDVPKIKAIEKRIKGLDNPDYNDIGYLINKIRKDYENIKNKEEIEDYIKKVEVFCKNYEKWFYDKFGRKSKKQLNN